MFKISLNLKYCVITTIILLILLPVNSVGYSIFYDSEVNIFDIYGENSTENIDNDNPWWYYKPNSYNELVNWYLELEVEYPNYIEVFKANEMYETGMVDGDYDLYYVRITNESLDLKKPEVLFLGGPHGDETVGTVGLYWFTDWLMRMIFTDDPCLEYSKDWLKWIVDNREIYIVISHNPYGFDSKIRYDMNDWDLNREADYDGPGPNTGGVWGSVNGKTLRSFIDNHLIRTGCDFHGGVRSLIYPWSSTYENVYGTSVISGKIYGYATPDFNFFDVSTLRLGDFIGDYGGDLNEDTIGPIPEMVNYEVEGGIAPWAYAADIEKNPLEDPYVKDEIFGNYPGCGILWISPEMSVIKNPSESTFGNDTVHRYGAEVRRIVLHQTDLAQPYVRWISNIPTNKAVILRGSTIWFQWQVNGCLVVDNTSIQWSKNQDPIQYPEYFSDFHDEYAGEYVGGTGWDDAQDGSKAGFVYEDEIELLEVGDYYFVARAKVDQVYREVVHPEVYGDNSYLRLIQERTNDTYIETLEGSDGIEEINGNLWWYSPVIHITVTDNMPPQIPGIPSGPNQGITGNSYSFMATTIDSEGDDIQYGWDFDDGSPVLWTGFLSSGESCNLSHSWMASGDYSIRVKARDINNGESDWSDSLVISIDGDNPLTINIINPENALYIKNMKIRSFLFRKPLIIGFINITADVSSVYSEIESVEFYIDDELRKVDFKNTYSFLWDEKSFGRYTIKVIAYDNIGNYVTKELVVWKFFR